MLNIKNYTSSVLLRRLSALPSACATKVSAAQARQSNMYSCVHVLMGILIYLAVRLLVGSIC